MKLVELNGFQSWIVPDRFPIPIIEELLGEIGGVEWFSKLDLHSGYR